MKLKILTVVTSLVTLYVVTCQNRSIPVDTAVTTQHNVTVNGNTFSYTAKTGMQPVWDDLGKPIETDIVSKIRTSEAIGPDEKNHFLHLLSYFTPGELDELRLLL